MVSYAMSVLAVPPPAAACIKILVSKGASVDGERYTWERPISTRQTGFNFVSQSRSWLPDAVGGVLWYVLDDTSTSCHVPLYAGISRVPESYTVGTIEKFSWGSAWWVFNFVANIANLKYTCMVEDILEVVRARPDQFRLDQPEEQAADLPY